MQKEQHLALSTCRSRAPAVFTRYDLNDSSADSRDRSTSGSCLLLPRSPRASNLRLTVPNLQLKKQSRPLSPLFYQADRGIVAHSCPPGASVGARRAPLSRHALSTDLRLGYMRPHLVVCVFIVSLRLSAVAHDKHFVILRVSGTLVRGEYSAGPGYWSPHWHMTGRSCEV